MAPVKPPIRRSSSCRRSTCAAGGSSASGRATSTGRRSTATTRSRSRAAFAGAGATWLHVVDLDGARDGRARQADVIARDRRRPSGDRLRVRGRAADCATTAQRRGALWRSGAARVVVGTAALDDPGFAARLVARHGPERIVVALDVRDGLAVGDGLADRRAWRPGRRCALDSHRRRRGRDLRGHGDRARRHSSEAPTSTSSVAWSRSVAAGSSRRAGSARSPTSSRSRRLGCAGAIVGRALYEGRLDLGDDPRRHSVEPRPTAGPSGRRPRGRLRPRPPCGAPR